VEKIIEPVWIRHALRHVQAGPNESDSVQTTESCSRTGMTMTDESDDRSACVAAQLWSTIASVLLDAFPFSQQVLLLYQKIK